MNKLIILFIALFVICNANPARDEIYQRIEQLAHLKDTINQARDAFSQFHNVATQNHNAIKNHFDNAAELSKRSAEPRVTCSVALATFFNVYLNGSCPGYIQTYFSTTTGNDAKASAVVGFCTDCAQQFIAAVQNVAVSCNRTEFNIRNASLVGFYPRFLCSKDGNDFCINKLASISVPADLTQVTNDQLNQLCSPCSLKLLVILKQTSTIAPAAFVKSVFALRAVCVKYKGDYCILKLKAATDFAVQIASKVQQGKEITAQDFKNILDVFCSICYRLFIARASFLGDNTQLQTISNFQALGSFCRKNQAKEYCLIKIFDTVKQIILSQGTTNPCQSLNGTCSDGCKKLVTDMVTKGGCCWSLIADALSGTGPGTDSALKQQIYDFIKSCSSVALPTPCASVGTATITVTYTNINVASVNANQAAFIAAVIVDLGISIGGIDGFNANATTVVATKKRDNSVAVTVSGVSVPAVTAGVLYTPDNDQCDTACNQAQPQDFSADVSVSTRSSNVQVTSSSTTVAVSFVLLSILSLFLF